MNYIDIILIIPLAYGLVQGIRKGFVKEVASLLAIIIGIYVARYFSVPVAQVIMTMTQWSASVCTILAYALLFIVVALCIHLIAWIISKLLGMIMLGGINRLFGAVFGTIKMVLLLSVILNCINMINNFVPLKENSAVKQSVLYEPIENVMESVIPFLNYDGFKKTVKEGAKNLRA